jgi:hypothetical protein
MAIIVVKSLKKDMEKLRLSREYPSRLRTGKFSALSVQTEPGRQQPSRSWKASGKRMRGMFGWRV